VSDERFTRSTNLIESSKGFQVQVLGRAGLLYREDDHVMSISSEVQMPPAGMIVYTASISRWEPPYEREALLDSRKGEIIDNIQRAFEFTGVDVEFSPY
jgi:hypothetical protein